MYTITSFQYCFLDWEWSPACFVPFYTRGKDEKGQLKFFSFCPSLFGRNISINFYAVSYPRERHAIEPVQFEDTCLNFGSHCRSTLYTCSCAGLLWGLGCHQGYPLLVDLLEEGRHRAAGCFFEPSSHLYFHKERWLHRHWPWISGATSGAGTCLISRSTSLFYP